MATYVNPPVFEALMELSLIHIYLTDAGMCGPAVGVLGRDREPIIQRFRTSMPAKFPVANWPVRLCGAVVQVEEATGRARNIARISKIVEKPAS